jgi:hypothetical protein
MQAAVEAAEGCCSAKQRMRVAVEAAEECCRAAKVDVAMQSCSKEQDAEPLKLLKLI